MSMYGILQMGAFVILRRQEAQVPAPHLQAHPERRPHIVSQEYRQFLKAEAPDLISMGGMVVYENESYPLEHRNRVRFMPRLLAIKWLHGWIVPPEEYSEPEVDGVFRPVDFIAYEKSQHYVKAVMDLLFGWRWLGPDGKPSGDVLGVYSERPLEVMAQDPLID